MIVIKNSLKAMSKNNQTNASGGKKKQSNMLNFFASSAAKKSKVLGKTQEEPLEVKDKTTPQKLVNQPERTGKKSPVSFK